MISQTELYCSLLKMFDSFRGSNIEFVYLMDKYDKSLDYEAHLNEIRKCESSFLKCKKLMNWLYSILIHDPNYVNCSQDNSLTLVGRLKNYMPINCRAAAVILTECLLAVGIPARSVWLMPFSPYDTDCHVVTMAYCRDLKKWVMLDATVNTIVENQKGIPLDPIEIREILKNQGVLNFSRELKYYRLNCTYDTQCKGYYAYLSKNMFYFKTYRINRYGYEEEGDNNLVYCMPAEFNYIKQFEIINTHNNIVHDVFIQRNICNTSSFSLLEFNNIDNMIDYPNKPSNSNHYERSV